MSTPRGRIGWYSTVWHNESGEWDRYEMTADKCPWHSKKFLERERQTMMAGWYAQEYGGEDGHLAFLGSEDGVFSWADLQKCLDADLPPLYPVNQGYA